MFHRLTPFGLRQTFVYLSLMSVTGGITIRKPDCKGKGERGRTPSWGFGLLGGLGECQVREVTKRRCSFTKNIFIIPGI